MAEGKPVFYERLLPQPDGKDSFAQPVENTVPAAALIPYSSKVTTTRLPVQSWESSNKWWHIHHRAKAEPQHSSTAALRFLARKEIP